MALRIAGGLLLCLQHKLYADAIARAYYAVLHTAKAALAQYNVEPRTHRALNPLFGRHIVIPGLVERHWGSVIGRLATLRMAADYNAEMIFSEADAAAASRQADAFANRIRVLLAGIVGAERLQPPPNRTGTARLLDPVGR